MKKLLRFIWSILEFVIVVYVIVITSLILCKNKYGYTQFGDYTIRNIDLMDERNVQGTKKGDLLIVKNTNDIKEGDLIYYYAAFNDQYIIRTDVVTHIDQDDYSALYTIERNNEKITIPSVKVLGKSADIKSKLGGILAIVESRIGFLFLVLLPIMIIFIYQVYEFIMILRYEKIEEEELNKDMKKLKIKAEVKTNNTNVEEIELL